MTKPEKIAIGALEKIAKAPRTYGVDYCIALAQATLDSIKVIKKVSK